MAINIGAGLLILSSILAARAARDGEPEHEPELAQADDDGGAR
jgi:hypothetical protein